MKTNREVFRDAGIPPVAPLELRRIMSRYRGRIVTLRQDLRIGNRRIVVEVDGLAVEIFSAPSSTLRQRRLRELLTGPSGVNSQSEYPWFWTMRDLIRGLGLKYSRRLCGEIGKELKAMAVEKRKVHGIINSRSQRFSTQCTVFGVLPLPSPDEIRQQYRAESKARAEACRLMRESIKLANGAVSGSRAAL